MPDPDAAQVELRGDILGGEVGPFLQPFAGEQHFREGEGADAGAFRGGERIGEFGATVLAVEVEGLVAEMRHQRGHVAGVGEGVVTLLRRRLVGVAEAAQIGSDDAEVGREQRDELVPVEMRLGRAVEQQQRLSLAGGHIVHADAIYPSPAMGDGCPGMVEDLCHRASSVLNFYDPDRTYVWSACQSCWGAER